MIDTKIPNIYHNRSRSVFNNGNTSGLVKLPAINNRSRAQESLVSVFNQHNPIHQGDYINRLKTKSNSICANHLFEGILKGRGAQTDFGVYEEPNFTGYN